MNLNIGKAVFVLTCDSSDGVVQTGKSAVMQCCCDRMFSKA